MDDFYPKLQKCSVQVSKKRTLCTIALLCKLKNFDQFLQSYKAKKTLF